MTKIVLPERKIDSLKVRFERERSYRHKYGCTVREFLVDEEDCCIKCSGSGYYSYSDTSTWRGGGGGQMFTTDVCNKCWGSGSDSKPWPRHTVT